MLVIGNREAAADIQEFESEAARLGLGENSSRHVQGLQIVFRVGTLAADVKTEPLDHQPIVVGESDQVHRFARQGTELAGEFDHGPRVRH